MIKFDYFVNKNNKNIQLFFNLNQNILFFEDLCLKNRAVV